MNKINHLPIPHYVQVETSYNCNTQCSFCYNPQKKTKIDYEKLRLIVQGLIQAKIPHIQFTGGEISLLPVSFINEMVDKLSEYSTVTIQTNGIKYLENLTKNVACIYISLHGTKEYHEKLQLTNSWCEIVDNIHRYIKDGFEVNCDFTLTSVNYECFEDIAFQASEWGVHQFSINKFEPAGLGVANFKELVPTQKHFSNVIDQIIRLQNKTDMLIGFCTAIPFCLDKRLPEYGLMANCGAGVSFLSISPNGEVRICNQSNVSYGNILKNDLLTIWNRKEIDHFRDASWVTEPCSNCFLFGECLAGCKVDNSLCSNYCVDYAVRDLKKVSIKKSEWNRKLNIFREKQKSNKEQICCSLDNVICKNKFSKLFIHNDQKLLITRHQTVELDEATMLLLTNLFERETKVKDFIQFALKKELDKDSSVDLLKTLLCMKAVYVKK